MDESRAWAERLLNEVLGRWLAVADRPNGLFHHRFDRAWQPLDGGPCTLVSQGRLIYNFCRGYQRTSDAAYADAAQRGLEALGRYFQPDPQRPWCWAVHPDGRLADTTANCYGHAFVMLAYATAAEALGESEFTARGLATWRLIQDHFADSHGGYRWLVGAVAGSESEQRSQNPLMHCYEALLALAVTDSSGTVRRAASELWRFLEARCLGPGRLPEWYDAAWQPLADSPRRGIDVGHACEWAFLLSEAAALGLGEELPERGREFLDYALAVGYDATEGGFISVVDFAGQPTSTHKGWWQQCEGIRALCRYARRHQHPAAAAALGPCLDYARRTFHDPELGGWYADPPHNLDKGNAYKLDYHVVNCCLELLA